MMPLMRCCGGMAVAGHGPGAGVVAVAVAVAAAAVPGTEGSRVDAGDEAAVPAAGTAAAAAPPVCDEGVG